jgi:hypothetical protein
MKKIFKISSSGLAVILFFLAISQVGMAEESVPLLPMTVKGFASIDGNSAPNGTVVEAYLNGEPTERFVINTSSGDYCFWISGNSEDERKAVTFTVDGIKTDDNIDWESGRQVLSLELSVIKGSNPRNSIKNLASKINLESLREIGKSEVFGVNSRSKVIESSVPEPDLKALKDMKFNSGNKGAGNSFEGVSKLIDASGFPLICTVAGTILLFLGYCLRQRESRKKR